MRKNSEGWVDYDPIAKQPISRAERRETVQMYLDAHNATRAQLVEEIDNLTKTLARIEALNVERRAELAAIDLSQLPAVVA